MELKGSKTEKNLMTAFAGESQARNKYTYFASVAKKEGYEQIAAIFLKTADNEKEHAKMWFKALGELGDTAQNLAAAAEIARQLRLRDMGGIIVIDFIDLHKSENRNALVEEMRKLMAADRAKHTILPLSKFGLMQITRQRVRPETQVDMREVCPACHGTGTVTPAALLDEQIENQIAYFAQDRGERYIRVRVNPVVAAFLKKGLFSLRLRWMMRYKCFIRVVANSHTGIIETKFFDRRNKELV